MRALLVVLLLLAAPAWGQESDAPFALAEGQPAPADGVFLSTARAGRIFQECEEAKRNAADFEKALQEQPETHVGAVVVAAGLGVFAGIALSALVLLVRK